MNIQIITTFGILSLAGTYSGIPAGAGHDSADQSATEVCLQAFLATIKPGYPARAQLRSAAASGRMIDALGSSPLAPYLLLDIEMTASIDGSPAALATGSCRVTRVARLQEIVVKVLDPSRLDQANTSTLRLAAIVR